MHVLVTGATGFIGSAVVRALLDRGNRVSATSRYPERARCGLPAEVTVVGWDALRGTLPTAAIAGADGVVNLAGVPIIGPPLTPGRKQVVFDSRVRGTRNLVQSFAASAPRVLVSGSAAGYYGDGGEDVLTEESPPGNDFAATMCRAWEDAARAAEAYGTRVVTVRAAQVLDAHGGALNRLLQLFKLGLGGRVGSGRQWWSWIHLADEVGLILHALDTESLSGPVNASAPHPLRNRDFTRKLARSVHRPAVVPVPALPLQLALGDASHLLLDSQRIVPRRAEASGYRFRFPTLNAALADILKRP